MSDRQHTSVLLLEPSNTACVTHIFLQKTKKQQIRGFLQTTYETATNFIPGDAEQPPRVQTPAVLKAPQPGSLPFFYRFQRQRITFKLNKRPAAKVTEISATKRSCHMCPALFFWSPCWVKPTPTWLTQQLVSCRTSSSVSCAARAAHGRLPTLFSDIKSRFCQFHRFLRAASYLFTLGRHDTTFTLIQLLLIFFYFFLDKLLKFFRTQFIRWQRH